jgi:hypothetical protein
VTEIEAALAIQMARLGPMALHGTKLVFESFESKPREGMGRQQEQAEGLRKKSKVFHTLCTCGT